MSDPSSSHGGSSVSPPTPSDTWTHLTANPRSHCTLMLSSRRSRRRRGPRGQSLGDGRRERPPPPTGGQPGLRGPRRGTKGPGRPRGARPAPLRPPVVPHAPEPADQAGSGPPGPGARPGAAGYEVCLHATRPPVAVGTTGATVNDLLLAALHLALDRWNAAGSGAIAVMMPINLRPAEWREDVVGNLSLMAPVRSTAVDRRRPDRLVGEDDLARFAVGLLESSSLRKPASSNPQRRRVGLARRRLPLRLPHARGVKASRVGGRARRARRRRSGSFRAPSGNRAASRVPACGEVHPVDPGDQRSRHADRAPGSDLADEPVQFRRGSRLEQVEHLLEISRSRSAVFVRCSNP